jgi:predicted glycoside hydrolase/deacetylase ChbG (UPF0249 family)
MRTNLVFAILAFGLTGLAAPTAGRDAKTPPRLIVRGDDMGFSHSANQALIQCHKDGIETTIEVLVPTPWFPEAVAMLAATPTVDVGIHLTLTSEWDLIKWRPIADVPSLRDADGFFHPMVFPNRHYPKRSVAETAWKLEDVEKEFRAQIELGRKRIPRVSHISAHMGCTHLNPQVHALAKKLAREYDLDLFPEELGVKSVGYNAGLATNEQRIDSFIKMLDGLESGKTYLTVEHPGLDGPELRAIHHVGYENVAEHRQGVTDVWTSPRVRQAVAARGIQLIRYKDLPKR